MAWCAKSSVHTMTLSRVVIACRCCQECDRVGLRRFERHKEHGERRLGVFAKLFRKDFFVHDHNKMMQCAKMKYEVSDQIKSTSCKHECAISKHVIHCVRPSEKLK